MLLLLVLMIAEAIGTQPNIVLMVADDLGWSDMPWHDSLAIAPTLTALAEAGTQLDRHYVQPICSPTRSALMTGKYPSRLGLQHGTINAGEPYGLMANETLISNYMKEIGYAVHGVGKWHLGYCSWELTPAMRGFDSFYGYYNGHETYFTKETHDFFDFRLDTLNRDGTVKDDVIFDNVTYSAYLYAKQADKVITAHNPEKNPLFLYFPIQNVHNPNEVPDSYYQMYEGIVEDKQRRTLLAMITAMDDAAKVVVDSLKAKGIWENTVFIFFSDNGGPILGIGNGQTNYPLRGGKYSYWEGGVRSTSFIYSPMLPPQGVNTQLLHVTDWLPTLAFLGKCGVHGDESKCSGPPLGDIDGVNQWGAIIGTRQSARQEFLVNIDQTSNNSALRWQNYKLYKGNPGNGAWVPPPKINAKLYAEQFTKHKAERQQYCSELDYVFAGPYDAQKIQLYDVVHDPAETVEISKDHPDVVNLMLKRLEYYMTRAVAPRNVARDPKSDPSQFNGTWTPWLQHC